MDNLQNWLDRIQGLLDFQKDLQLETVHPIFNRIDLIQLQILLNTLKDLVEKQENEEKS